MVQNDKTWTFEHSADCGATVEFAWRFWTNISNWVLDADIESVEIDGAFTAGARGSTNSKTSGRVEWRIVEAQIGRAVIELPLHNAVGRFVWIFENIDGHTRITQRCTFDGEQADTYAKAIGPSLEESLPAGMRKLCRSIEDAARLG